MLCAMCGRFVSFSDPEQLAERFAVDEVRTDPLPPRYNVAPTLDVYAVIESAASRRLGTLRWGFVPPWSKDPRKGPINARVEGLAESRMFAPALARRRCLIPADGFYEWQERGEGRRKQPYHLHDPDGQPLAFAGLYSVWRDDAVEDPDPLFSCAIVTTRARGEMERIHHRSPLMLPERLWREWLTAEPDEAGRLRDTVAEIGPPRLTAEPVSDRVNNVRNDGPELLEPGEVAD
jgi:putative SOS response-associated peptidase YedK